MAEVVRLVRETAFDPETIQILSAALDETWDRLRKSGSRLARPAYSRAMREVVAKRIIEMAPTWCRGSRSARDQRPAIRRRQLRAIRRTSEINIASPDARWSPTPRDGENFERAKNDDCAQ
jgi:hypothetical protein